ncbi:NfeD family protein [Virgisporangium aurantiacum]|uniref:Membrane protein n=1 Tax=Virgisporangium aurantiacum TaxID=175570 RepID=A0A8J4E402_9ACTN|nr:NfeD family protein [Virgisporangium aurantiacum]GIJ60641.1 membrane protein [Virgisporangium aurantiacum]
MAALIWILAAVGLAVAELFTTSFFLIMFALGAVAAAAAAALDAPVSVQAIIFVIVSLIATLGVRPVLRRNFGRDAGEPTPVAEIAGSEAIVLERVDDRAGMIKIDGEYWQARALESGQVIEPGERVHVVELKGVTAMVWRV